MKVTSVSTEVFTVMGDVRGVGLIIFFSEEKKVIELESHFIEEWLLTLL